MQDCNTALHIAAKLGNSEVTKALLHAGANPILTNDVSSPIFKQFNGFKVV